MNRFRNRLIIAAAAAMIAAPLAASPAGAIPIAGNGCNATAFASAQISWFPAAPASASGLSVGCGLNNNPGTSQVSASFSVHDTDAAQYHNGAAKPVTNSVAAISGATTIQLNPAGTNITGLPVAPVQMNRMISGTGIGVRTVVTSMTAGGLVTLNRPTTGAVPINSTLKIENAIARGVDDATAVASNIITSAQANFTAADIGCSVSGTGINPANSVTITGTGVGTATISGPAITLTGPTVSICGSLLTSTVRQVTGVTITTAVRFVSPGGIASFVASDIGLPVSGVCTQLTAAVGDDFTIPAGVVITATPSQTNGDTSGGLVVSSGCTIVIGASNANAPGNGDQAAQQSVALNLNPSLVAGTDDCANDQPEGFQILANWYNPGSFQGSGATNLQPGPSVALPATAGTKAVGQLFFDTSAADFSAFVIERKTLTAGDPIGTVHYDVLFPFAPTGLALCPGTATSPGIAYSLAVNATTATQSTSASGTGRPGTGQVRNIKPSATGGYTGLVEVKSDGAVVFSPVSQFQRLCIFPAGFPNPVNFQCGK